MFLVTIKFARYVLQGFSFCLSKRLEMNYDETDGTTVKAFSSK